MRVRVYRNLTRDCLSVQTYQPGRGWRLASHRQSALLANATFMVSTAGRDRVRRTGRKTVHAYVVGDLLEGQRDDLSLPLYRVQYNPKRDDGFVWRDTGAAVSSSPLVLISAETGMVAAR